MSAAGPKPQQNIFGTIRVRLDFAAGNALDRNLGALAAVLRRVNGDEVRQAVVRAAAEGVLLPITRPALIMAPRLKPLLDQRLQNWFDILQVDNKTNQTHQALFQYRRPQFVSPVRMIDTPNG